jgi:hypothetical protein
MRQNGKDTRKKIMVVTGHHEIKNRNEAVRTNDNRIPREGARMEYVTVVKRLDA